MSVYSYQPIVVVVPLRKVLRASWHGMLDSQRYPVGDLA